jgi:hypothetical protein
MCAASIYHAHTAFSTEGVHTAAYAYRLLLQLTAPLLLCLQVRAPEPRGDQAQLRLCGVQELG